MNGLYLQEQQVYLVANKRKTLVVKPVKLDKYINEPLYLLAKNKIYGIVKLSSPEEVDIPKFATLYKEHHINEAQRKKWWGRDKKLYIYKIEVVELLKPCLYWRLTDRPRTFIDNVEVEKSISVRIPIEQLTMEHLKLLSTDEIAGIQKRIELIATMVDAKSSVEMRKAAALLYVPPAPKKDVEPDKFILQLQINDIDGGDISLDSEVLKAKYKYQYLLRLQQDSKIMTGWDLNVKNINGQKMPAVPKSEQSASVWLGVSQHPSYIVNIDDNKKIKYFTLDKGKYTNKKLSETAFEYVFNGGVLKGQYTCSRRYKGKKWSLEKVK